MLLEENLVGSTGDLEGLWMLLDKGVDVAHALLFEDLVDSDKDTRLLNIAKAVVDGCTKELHRRRETHVGIHQRRDIVAEFVIEKDFFSLARLYWPEIL